jgi:homoserine O-succinyltransferase/O-acetyltransferase
MPIHVDAEQSSYGSLRDDRWPRHNRASQRREESSRCVSIGLINNMPQAAFTATERQFTSILDAASEGIEVRLSLYSLLDLPKRGPGDNNNGSHYSSVDKLWEADLDALIVTGKEPATTNLIDEPCWESLTQVLEWARENTYSAVWSCLAAHAAVLYLDGIRRRKSEEKNFGVFECVCASGHPLMTGAPPRFTVPHSRWNSLSEEDLVSRGYSVLTRIAGGGVDAFIKDERSLFVFFQGHPEYDADTLLREYRRDAGRYLNHDATTYPSIPRSYFDASTVGALTALRDKAMSSRSEELFASVCTALEATRVENAWRPTMARIYRNWLEYICTRKSGSQLDDANVA